MMCFKMKKLFIFGIVLILLTVVVYSIPNLDEINNPESGFSDFFVDVTNLGADLNLSGYNITATNGTFTNLLVINAPDACPNGTGQIDGNGTVRVCGSDVGYWFRTGSADIALVNLLLEL